MQKFNDILAAVLGVLGGLYVLFSLLAAILPAGSRLQVFAERVALSLASFKAKDKK